MNTYIVALKEIRNETPTVYMIILTNFHTNSMPYEQLNDDSDGLEYIKTRRCMMIALMPELWRICTAFIVAEQADTITFYRIYIK